MAIPIRLRQVLRPETATMWANALVTMGGWVWILALLLPRMAPGEFSTFLLAYSIVGFAPFLTFGLTPTLTRFFAFAFGGASLAQLRERRLEGPNEDRFSAAPGGCNWGLVMQLWRVSRAVYCILAGFALVAFASGGSYVLHLHVERVADPISFWMPWIFLLGTAAASMGLSYMNAFMMGSGRVTAFYRIALGTNALAFAALTGVVLIHPSLASLVLVKQSFLLLQALIVFRACRRILGPVSGISHAPPDRSLFGLVWQASWRSGVGQLLQQGAGLAVTLVYTLLSSVEQSAAFLLATRLLQAVSGLAQAPFYGRLPLIQAAWFSSTSQQVRRYLAESFYLSLLTAAGLFLVLYALGESALSLVGSATRLPHTPILAAMGISLLFERAGGMHIQIYTLSNHIIWHYLAIGYVATLLPVAALFFLLWGSDGIIYAVAASHLAFYYPVAAWHSRKLLPGLQREIDLKGVLPLSLALIAGVILVDLIRP